MTSTYSSIINKTRRLEPLTRVEADALATALLSGELDTPTVYDILTALHQKGETTDEICGFIDAMRRCMTPVPLTVSPIIDICGTGGSLPNRFNVSSSVALLLGRMGHFIAKHGNRGSKRANGSFDFLDALNIPYDLSVTEHNERLKKYGVTFLFARHYHAAVRHAADARQQMSTSSIFNMIGPFCNPASPSIQIIGTPTHDMAHRLLAVGRKLSYKTFAIISSDIGLDECSTVGLSTVHILKDNQVSTLTINPMDYGIHHHISDITVSPDALAVDNAKLFKQLIQAPTSHPIAELITLNAGVITHLIDPTITIEDAITASKTAFQTLTLG